MGNDSIFQMFENPRRGRQARNFTTNVLKILDLKLSPEQMFSKNWRWVPLATLCSKANIPKKIIYVVLRYLLRGTYQMLDSTAY